MTETKTKRNYEQNITLKFGVKDTLHETTEAELQAMLMTRIEPSNMNLQSTDSISKLEDVRRGYREVETQGYVLTNSNGVDGTFTVADMSQKMVDYLTDSDNIHVEPYTTTEKILLEDWTLSNNLRLLNVGLNQKLGLGYDVFRPYFWSARDLNLDKDEYKNPTMCRYFVFWSNDSIVEWNGGNISWVKDYDADPTTIKELTVVFNLEAKTPDAFTANESTISTLVDYIAQAFLGTNMFSSKAVSCAGSINATVPVSCEAITANDLPSFSESGR